MQPVISFISSIPTDWFVIGAIFVAASVDAWRNGSSRAVGIAFALPAAFLFFTVAPNAFVLGALTKAFSASSFMMALLFIGFFAAAYFMVYRVAGLYGYPEHNFGTTLLTGYVMTAFIIGFWFLVPSMSIFWHFGKTATSLFGGGMSLWWVLSAYIALGFIRS